MSYTYQYPRPALSVDIVLFGFQESQLSVLLIQRANPPFAGDWALPGGFVDLDETLEQAALRELQEETGLSDLNLEQLHAFSTIDRDPRERVISIAFYGLVKQERYQPVAADDARDARWFPIENLPQLAFDHQQIFSVARQRLKAKLQHQPPTAS
ncbi:MAG: NUDIX hydrolase [Pirellulaceae bacterium]|nr:NUDIX hydrolase [Pirellulaceae bacterium]